MIQAKGISSHLDCGDSSPLSFPVFIVYATTHTDFSGGPARQVLLRCHGGIHRQIVAGTVRKDAVVLETWALYSTELTDEEHDLGFELVEIRDSESPLADQSGLLLAVAYRFSEFDQVAKMNVPVIGGNSYRHERLRTQHSGEARWIPAGAVVFPSAAQALDSIGTRGRQMQLCH